MPRLAEREYRAVLAIVTEAATTPPDDPLPVTTLDSIRRLFPVADTIAFFQGRPWDRASRRLTVAGDYRPWSAEERQLHDVLRFQFPLWPSPATIGRALRITDMIPLREYRRTNLYQDLGRVHGIEHSMSYWMPAPDGVVRGLALDSSTRDYTDREQVLFEVLGQHLAAVLRRLDPRPVTAVPGLPLTPREAEILALVDAGLTNREIADRLSLSPHTIRTHLENAYDALGTHSRTRSLALLRDRQAESPSPGGSPIS